MEAQTDKIKETESQRRESVFTEDSNHDLEKQADAESKTDAQEQTTSAAQDEEKQEYPPFKKALPVMAALYLCIFLIALDRTIIATAIPSITNEFNSFGDIGWYASAYMLTNCSMMLTMGRLYTFYSAKMVFLVNLLIFEIGSVICAAAPNSTAFIIGRAIAGFGSAGIFGGAIVIVTYTIPLHKRPVWMGLSGAIFGVSSVIGPLMGGAFTTSVTWRWCFYINLPIGGLAAAVVLVVLKLPPPRDGGLPIRQQLNRLDPIGFSLLVPAIVCLLLALQWGGSTYSWNSGRIIALLTIFSVLTIAFVAVQLWKKENATVPPRIVNQRSIACGAFFAFFNASSMFLMVYFLPLWFQAIKGANAVNSGIMNIPLILSLVLALILSGFAVKKIGYYTPFMISGSVLSSVGAGLITTFTTTTAHPKWIGYQVILGIGIGLGQQQASLAAQKVLKRKDVPTGLAVQFFGQQLGGTVFSSAGQNILNTRLISGLRAIPNLDFDPTSIVHIGATEINKTINKKLLPEVLRAYNSALTKGPFTITIVVACLAFLFSLGMEWKSIKPGADEAKKEESKAATEESGSDEKTRKA